jgi:hypothetical protein
MKEELQLRQIGGARLPPRLQDLIESPEAHLDNPSNTGGILDLWKVLHDFFEGGINLTERSIENVYMDCQWVYSAS